MNLTGEFLLGSWLVEPSTRRISRDEQICSLEPLPMKVLLLLVEREGDVVSAREITNRVWGSNHVGDSPVAHAIAQIRKLLNDDSKNPEYIETIPKTGYRMIATVSYKQKPTRSGIKKTLLIANAIFIVIGLLWFAMYSQNNTLDVAEEARLISPILVLFPLTNLTGGVDNNHLSKSMTEELNRAMAQVDEVSIINSYSTNEFLRQDGSYSNVLKVLGASHTLSGTLQGSDDNLRVVIRLIDNVAGVELFTQTRTLEQSDVLLSQMGIALELASRVSEHLGVSVADFRSPLYVTGSGANKETSLNAHQVYVKGQIALSLSTRDGYFLAEKHFEDAVKMDPDFALAWIALTRARSILLSRTFLPRDTAYPRALEASDRAINAAPHMASAWAQGCRLRLIEMQDKTGSKPYCQRAFELDPDAQGVRRAASQIALIEGDLDAAIKATRRRVELDPLRSGAYSYLGLLLFFAGAFDLAVESTQQALALDLNQQMAHGLLGHVALANNNPELAIEYFNQESVPVYRLQGLAMAHFASGQRLQSGIYLDQLERDHANDAAFQIAEIYGHRNNAQKTINWLERSVEGHDGGLTFLLVSPYLTFIHADSRYQNLRSKAFQ